MRFSAEPVRVYPGVPATNLVVQAGFCINLVNSDVILLDFDGRGRFGDGGELGYGFRGVRRESEGKSRGRRLQLRGVRLPLSVGGISLRSWDSLPRSEFSPISYGRHLKAVSHTPDCTPDISEAASHFLQ